MIYLFIIACIALFLSDIADTELSVKIFKDLGYVEGNALYGKGTQPSRLKFYAISTPINFAILATSYFLLRVLPPQVPLWLLAPSVGTIRHALIVWRTYRTLKAAGKI